MLQYLFHGYIKTTHTAYEYYDCYYDRHHCITQLREQPIDKKEHSPNSRHIETMANEEFLRDTCKVNLISMWECQWNKQMKTSQNIQTFIHDHCSDIEELLRPKVAFNDAFSAS